MCKKNKYNFVVIIIVSSLKLKLLLYDNINFFGELA